MPAVRAERTRPHQCFLGLVTCPGDLDRTTDLQIDMRSPGHFGNLLRREQLAVLAIEDIEEAVLRCVHDALTLCSPYFRSASTMSMLSCNPRSRRARSGSATCRPAVGVEGHDRTQEEIVTPVRRADFPVPGTAVAGTHQDLVEFGIVGDAMPDVAAAAEFPPFPGPGLGRHFHRRILETFRGIARHHPETPGLFAGVGIVGGDVAACGLLFGTAVADDDLALEDLGRAGDVVGTARVDGHRLPDFSPVL